MLPNRIQRVLKYYLKIIYSQFVVDLCPPQKEHSRGLATSRHASLWIPSVPLLMARNGGQQNHMNCTRFMILRLCTKHIRSRSSSLIQLAPRGAHRKSNEYNYRYPSSRIVE